MKVNSKHTYRILLVEDEKNFGTIMRDYLNMNGYKTIWCENGEIAKGIFNDTEFDLCILDVMMPQLDGFTLGKFIKETKPNTPLIYLTAKTLKDDMIKGYKIGADDYLTKPFDSDLLLLKINAILKRNKTLEQSPEQQIGKYTFNHILRTLKFESEEIRLSPKENALLKLLCDYKNNLLSRELALNSIWKNDTYFTARSMDVYIVKLRKHLSKDQRLEILNLHGNGYSLKLNE